MTSLQIAEETGKPHNDVLKAIRKMESAWEKVNGGKFSLVEYYDAKGEKRPMYELTKRECLYVATKFNDEARAKLVIRWEQLETQQFTKPLSQLEIIAQSAQILLEQDRRINNVEREVLELKAKTATRPNYFTIVGYGTLHKVSVNLKQASSLGRKASDICKRRGIEMDKMPDPRFGEVKLYPTDVLEEVFNAQIN